MLDANGICPVQVEELESCKTDAERQMDEDILCPYCETPRQADDLECCDGTQIEQLEARLDKEQDRAIALATQLVEVREAGRDYHVAVVEYVYATEADLYGAWLDMRKARQRFVAVTKEAT